jgi:type I restriction enzyme S subunit
LIGEAYDKRFLRIAINGRLDEMIAKAHGAVGLQHITKGKLELLVLPVPPLAEQRRIVAKVEELLALCDELEARQTAAHEHRTRLVRSSLDHLTTAKDEADFQKHSAFCLQHSELLFDSVPALRQAILSLAGEGRLVPQKSTETANGLLLKTQAQKKRLENEGVIKESKPLPPIEKEELEHMIPDSWVWARLGDICELITDGTHLTPKYAEKGRMFLSAQNVKPFRFIPDKHRFVSEADYQGYIKNRKPEFGDILLTRVGAGIGEAAVIDQRLDFAIYVSIALVRPAKGLIDPRYITLWLNSPHGTRKSRQFTYGVGMSQGNLNLGQIRKFVVPLPPLAEQQRIVTKVDELMRWCDALEARLAEAQTTATHLLDATLHKLLSDP